MKEGALKLPKEEKKASILKKRRYQEKTELLIFLIVNIKPNIAFAILMVS